MRSSNRQYLGSVDHIRAFAALLVVFYHAVPRFSGTATYGDYNTGRDWIYSQNPATTIIAEGHSSVTLFMVLSGFIFTVGTLDRRVSFTRFLTNRFLRIYPLFLLLLFVGMAAAPGAFTLWGFIQQLVGLGNLPGAMTFDPVGAMFWAVAVEVQFYLLFPALNALLSRFGMTTFLRLFAAIIALRALVWAVSKTPIDPNQMLYFTLVGRIDHFLFGMIAAWLFVRHGDRFRGAWKVIGSLALAVAMLWSYNYVHAALAGGWTRLIWLDVEGAVWALAILTYVVTVRSTKFWSRAIAKLGEMSYSIYLIHFMIISIVLSERLWINFPGISPRGDALLTTLLVVVPVTLVISYLTYQGVEKPFLQFRVKYLLPAEDVLDAKSDRTGGTPVVAIPPVPPAVPPVKDAQEPVATS